MPIAVLEQYDDGIAFVVDVGVISVAAQPDCPAALAGHRAIELSGNAALALAQHVVDRRRHAGNGARHGAGWSVRSKPWGNSSAMKAVESLPARQRGCCMIAARNGML